MIKQVSFQPSAIHFGAKFMEHIPLHLYQDGKYQQTVAGEVYLASSFRDYYRFSPILEQWNARRNELGQNTITWSFGGIFKHWRHKISHRKQDKTERIYFLTLPKRKRLLGFMRIKELAGNTRQIWDIEKAPDISSDKLGTRIRNILQGLLYVDLKHYPLQPGESCLKWAPTDSSKPGYRNLFSKVLGHPPQEAAMYDWSITREEVQRFVEQSEIDFQPWADK